MTLSVFMNVLQEKNILVSARCSTTALKLAEALVPLFDNVRLCAPIHRHWMLPGNFVPCGFWVFAQVGLEEVILRSHLLLCHQDSTMCSCFPSSCFKR